MTRCDENTSESSSASLSSSSSSKDRHSPLTPLKATISDDGDIFHLRNESSQKLKSAWESIYRKFEDAHLQVQDEIYLGRPTIKGDRMRVIRDRGHIRSLAKTPLGFGCFYIDKAELIGCDSIKREEQQDDTTDEGQMNIKTEGDQGDEERQLSNAPQTLLDDKRQQRPVWSTEDPDLREFLQEEEKRKAVCGNADSEDERDDDDDVFGIGSIVDLSKLCRSGRRSKNETGSGNDRHEEGPEVYSLALAAWDAEESALSDRNNKQEVILSLPFVGEDLEREISPLIGAHSPILSPSQLRSRYEQAQNIERATSTPRQQSQLSTKSSVSGSRKRKREGLLLPQWERSPRSAQSYESGCQGRGKCTKSLCLMCGGL